MSDVEVFAVLIGAVSLAGLAAVYSGRLAQVLRVPAPALFTIAAALMAWVLPWLGEVPVSSVQRVVTVMLVLLLFDGGMHIGRSRLRSATGAIVWVGLAGTAVTAVGFAALAHWVFGIDWLSALLLGVAVSPTDPAVVFSVLGRREVSGRTGVILEGESGANDPVGIAAMAALLAAGTAGGWHAVGTGIEEFALQMVLGALVGIGGGWMLLQAMRRSPLASGALYPLQTLLGAGVIYSLASVMHGSGFLAVFIAGILIGDERAPYKGEIERFHASLASLGEIVAFIALGLTVDLASLFSGSAWAVGLGLGALLAFVVRPVLVGLLLLRVRLTGGERAFVMWSGLKGAVPILLGTYILTAAVPGAARLYQIVVVVVLFSVLVQGSLVPLVARWARVPMHDVAPEPWALGMRFRDEPAGLHRWVVSAGSPADGLAVQDLPLGEGTWVCMVSRDGALVPEGGRAVLLPGDEVLLLEDPDGHDDPAPLFAAQTVL